MLELLLGTSDVSPREFREHYWGKRTLVTRGDPHALAEGLGLAFDAAGFDLVSAALSAQEERIARANAQRGLDIGAPWRATFDQKRFIARRGPNTFMQVRPEQIPLLLDAGASVQLASLDMLEGDPAGRIARSLFRLRGELQFPGDLLVGATRSPAGSGFESHFDPTAAFIVQTAGRKRYWLSQAPVMPFPRSKAYLFSDGTVGYRPDYQAALAPWEEIERVPDPLFDACVELSAGDCIYLPPGVAHRTEALSESFALLVIFSQRNPLHLVHALLQRALLPEPTWREQPAFAASDAPHGRLPERVVASLGARLDELRQVVGALRPDGYELVHALRQDIARVESWPPVRHDDRPIARESRLRPTRDGVLQIARGKDLHGIERAAVFRGQTEIEVEGEWAELLVRVATTEGFIADDVCAWLGEGGARLEWDEVREVLVALVAQGIIEQA